MNTTPIIPGLVAAFGALAGCQAPPPLHANMTNAEIGAFIEERFPRGTPLQQVQQELTALEIEPRDQRVIERETGPVLTAWLWEIGGPWADRDPILRWVEADMWFDRDRRLRGYDLVRRNHGAELLFYTIDPRRNPQIGGRIPAEDPPPPGPPPPPAPPPQG